MDRLLISEFINKNLIDEEELMESCYDKISLNPSKYIDVRCFDRWNGKTLASDSGVNTTRNFNIFNSEADGSRLAYFFANGLVENEGWFTPDGYNFYEDEDVYEEVMEYLQ